MMEAPMDVQWKDLYEIIDKEKITMLGTYRNGVGPVGRAMAVAKRDGPDILYLANKHSQKFKDLETNKEVNVSFQNSTGQGWVSITGEATSTSNDDPRIKELYTPTISAWFGDLGDGVHDGTDKDPRMAIIAVTSKHINYWKNTKHRFGIYEGSRASRFSREGGADWSVETVDGSGHQEGEEVNDTSTGLLAAWLPV